MPPAFGHLRLSQCSPSLSCCPQGCLIATPTASCPTTALCSTWLTSGLPLLPQCLPYVTVSLRKLPQCFHTIPASCPPNSVDPGCLGVHQGYLNVPKAASLFAYQLNPHPTSCHHVPPPVPQCLPWHLTQGPPTALASPQLPQCSSGCLNFVKPHFLDIFPWCFVVSFLVASLSQCLPCRQQYINKWGEAECRGLLMGL